MGSIFQWAVLLLLCSGAAAGRAQPDQRPSYDSLVLAARAAASRSDYALATTYYQEAVKIRSDMPELWANLGLTQDATGSYADAIESFRKAVLLKPSLYVPNLFLGIDYTHLHRAREAIPFLIKAEAINRHDPLVPLSLGRAYLLMNNYAAASSAFRQATALDGTNGSAWFLMGVAALGEVDADGWQLSKEGRNSAWVKDLYSESLQEQLRLNEAVSAEQAVLTTDPHFPCAHSRLGFLYLAQQQNAAAAQEFSDESPGCALAALGRARMRIDAGDDAEALAALRTLWEHDPGFVRSHASLLTGGLVSERSNTFSVVLDREHETGGVGSDLYESLSAALRDAPQPIDEFTLSEGAKGSGNQGLLAAAEVGSRDGRYGRCVADLAGGIAKRSDPDLLLLAGCAFMTGNYSLSAEASNRIMATSPHDMAALYWSIKANEKLAFEAFSRFEQLEPDSARTHVLLGDMYRQRHRFQQAENEYKTASVLAPHDPAPLFGLASSYFQDSNPDQALNTARTALEMNPGDPDLNLLVGEILVSRHAWAQAEDYLKRALSAKPQMLPHLHALLGQVYENTARPKEAIAELRMGVASDEDGTVYYQLARIYNSIGDRAAAQDAFQHMKTLQQRRRESAVLAVQDSSDVLQNDIH